MSFSVSGTYVAMKEQAAANLLSFGKIAEATLGVAASSLTFSNIPTGYKLFKISFHIIASATFATYIQFNDDAAAANYRSGYMLTQGAAGEFNSVAYGTSATVINLPVNINNSAVYEANITNIATKKKTAFTLGGEFSYLGLSCGDWSNVVDEISKIKIFSHNGGNYAVGSRFILYGALNV